MHQPMKSQCGLQTTSWCILQTKLSSYSFESHFWKNFPSCLRNRMQFMVEGPCGPRTARFKDHTVQGPHGPSTTRSINHTVHRPHGPSTTRSNDHTVQRPHGPMTTRSNDHTVQRPHRPTTTPSNDHTVQRPHTPSNDHTVQLLFSTYLWIIFFSSNALISFNKSVARSAQLKCTPYCA